MTNNIYRVRYCPDLDEILRDHAQKLVVVMFSSKSCGPCINFKPKFIQHAKQNPNCFFVYIDVNDFEDKNGKYIGKVRGTPKFVYFFNSQEVGDVLGAKEVTFLETLNFFKDKIEERKREIMQRDISAKQQELFERQMLEKRKIDMLNKLYDLTSKGVKLTQSYNIDSDLQQMIWEYQLHTNPHNQLKLPQGQEVQQQVPQQIQQQMPQQVQQQMPQQVQQQVPQQMPQQVPQQVQQQMPQQVSQQMPQQMSQHMPQQMPQQVQQQMPQQVPQQVQQQVQQQMPQQVQQQMPQQVQQVQQQMPQQVQLNNESSENQQQTNPQQEDMFKKQEQLNKIQELRKFQQMKQFQELFKLQQLKQLHIMKEQREKQSGIGKENSESDEESGS